MSKETRIADRWIRELRTAGCTYEDMELIIKLARKKYYLLKRNN